MIGDQCGRGACTKRASFGLYRQHPNCSGLALQRVARFSSEWITCGLPIYQNLALTICRALPSHRVTLIGKRLPLLVRGHSARSARMGSVRAARQAGKKHAAVDATVITANAAAKASGSRGLS